MEATVLIEDLGKEGEGVGRADGKVLFVPGATVGDRVRVRFTDDERAFARAELIHMVEPSRDRRTPECALYGACGGCQTMDLTYEAELRVKERRVRDALVRIGGVADPPIEPIVPAADPLHYRYKATMPAGGGKDGIVFGYYARGTHRLLDVEACPVLAEPVLEAALAVRRTARKLGLRPYDERTGCGDVRSLLVRVSRETGEVMVVITGSRALPVEGWTRSLPGRIPMLRSLAFAVLHGETNRLVGEDIRVAWGQSTITEGLLGLSFRISPGAFFQSNPAMAARLFAEAREKAREAGTGPLLDLYAGCGVLALLMAHGRERVEGVEVVRSAVRDARRNAEQNGLGHALFFRGSAEEVLETRLAEGAHYDVVALDPPRKGARESVPAILRASPRRIVYVSCDPATLARDVALLAEHYRLTSARPYDFFPRTVHVETLAVLDRV